MSERRPHHCSGAVAPCHPLLRFRIAEAIGDLVEEGQRPLGRRLGVAGNTVARWGSDLDQWPLAKALDLAAQVPAVRQAMVECLQGGVANAAEPTAAIAEAHQAMAQAGALVAEIAQDVSDGRFDAGESARICARSTALRALLEQLERDVAAAAGAR